MDCFSEQVLCCKYYLREVLKQHIVCVIKFLQCTTYTAAHCSEGALSCNEPSDRHLLYKMNADQLQLNINVVYSCLTDAVCGMDARDNPMSIRLWLPTIISS